MAQREVLRVVSLNLFPLGDVIAGINTSQELIINLNFIFS
ncbi:hypothetical protein AHYW_000224 [Providencia manganoxydans]